MATKIILDTDIGSDIDDAVCLAYLLAQPACELLGITTVTGQAVERARMADVIVKAAGKSIPIFPGIEKPLLVPSLQPIAKQASMIGSWPHQKDFPPGQAIEFMRRTIRQHPHEVVLLAIGPLTNVAMLFALDPEIPSLLKSLVLMGGNFSPVRWGRLTEWNILNDPHAAAMVYRAPVPVFRSIGLDVTTQVVMKPVEVRKHFTHPLLAPVLDFAKVWFGNDEHPITFHDPLAGAVIFQPDLCTFAKGTVEVELQSQQLAGFTHWTPGKEPCPHEVAEKVDVPGFFKHYFSVFQR